MRSAELKALVGSVFGGMNYPLAGWYADQLSAIPPLQTFTSANATKIRKKARQATDSDPQRDLQCELAVAAALAADRRSTLTYEPLMAAGQRGPDFLLHHKGHTNVFAEVSRLRPAQSSERAPAERIAAVLCGKLGQLASGAANLLVLVSDDRPCTTEAIAAAILSIRQHADAKDDAYFAFRGLASARLLHQTLPRLSGILTAAPALGEDLLFLPPQARHPLPTDLIRAIRAWDLSKRIGPPASVNRPAEP